MAKDTVNRKMNTNYTVPVGKLLTFHAFVNTSGGGNTTLSIGGADVAFFVGSGDSAFDQRGPFAAKAGDIIAAGAAISISGVLLDNV
jgi:hypothetical protein